MPVEINYLVLEHTSRGVQEVSGQEVLEGPEVHRQVPGHYLQKAGRGEDEDQKEQEERARGPSKGIKKFYNNCLLVERNKRQHAKVLGQHPVHDEGTRSD